MCGVARRGAAVRVDRTAATILRNDGDTINTIACSSSADCTVSIAVPLVVNDDEKRGRRQGNVGVRGSDKSPGEGNLSVTSNRVM